MNLPDHYSELAPFAEAFDRGTPALLYHRLGWAPPFAQRRGLTLPPGVFRRQLRELRAAGFSTEQERLWLTFDDGDATALGALEPLRESGFRAVMFLVAGRIGGVNDWDGTGAPLMDEAQVRDWLAAGQGIGSHTLTHARLPGLDPVRAREEIGASRRALEDRFGVAVELFAYPWGAMDERMKDLVAEAGYRLAFTTEGGVNDAATPRLALRRYTAWCALRRPRELWLALTS